MGPEARWTGGGARTPGARSPDRAGRGASTPREPPALPPATLSVADPGRGWTRVFPRPPWGRLEGDPCKRPSPSRLSARCPDTSWEAERLCTHPSECAPGARTAKTWGIPAGWPVDMPDSSCSGRPRRVGGNPSPTTEVCLPLDTAAIPRGRVKVGLPGGKSPLRWHS